MTTLRLCASRVFAPTGHIHAPAHDTYTNGIDWLAVERAASGDWPRTQLTHDETREAALLMTRAGHTEQEASIRLSTYTRQIARWKAAAETQTPPTNTPEATMTATDWRDDARCRFEDPELFFPVGNTGPALLQIEEAKNICRRCPVMETCLQWALETGQDTGVWGGLSEDERRAMKRRAARRSARQVTA